MSLKHGLTSITMSHALRVAANTSDCDRGPYNKNTYSFQVGSAITSPESVALPLLPLENGDRLTRDEFERRYAAMPHVKKAELIEGIVRLDLDNEPQPDGILRIDETCGGQSRISSDDYIEGPRTDC